MYCRSIILLLQERQKRAGQLQELTDVWTSHYSTLEAELAERRRKARVSWSLTECI